jgi:competence CoiA-like predicted nuclease
MKTKFAIVDGKKTEAHKGLHGLCPVCKNPVIAKCGEIKAHHWAHESTQNCDPWWENKGEWHRKWQDEFDNDWQEIIVEENGEKHIADIKTPDGLVIEFQHSPISKEEQQKREKFYKNMIWVVDCSNSKTAHKKFQKKILSKNTIEGTDFAYISRDCFPDAWQKKYRACNF